MGRRKKYEEVPVEEFTQSMIAEAIPADETELEKALSKIEQLEKEKIDLIQQLQNKDYEIQQLTQAIQEQGYTFNETVGSLIYTLFAPKQ